MIGWVLVGISVVDLVMLCYSFTFACSVLSPNPYSHAKFIDPAKSHVNPETVNETYLEIRLCPFKFVSKRFF